MRTNFYPASNQRPLNAPSWASRPKTPTSTENSGFSPSAITAA